MRFYLEYINHLGRLQKKSAHRRLQAGFTITEVLLAGLMMLIAVFVAGNGLINLLRTNYRANADSEIRNNLNRTLEFVSDEVRRARIIAKSEAEIKTDQVLGWKDIPGARAVLAFQIPNPRNPNSLLFEQIVYYTREPKKPEPEKGLWYSLTGPRVLWRYGPDLDANGNYVIGNYIHSPVTDMLAATADPEKLVCPDNFKRIPTEDGNVGGFFACVHENRNRVILNANAQVKMTTNDEVKYSVSTTVFARACRGFCDLGTPTPFYLTQNKGSGTSDPPTLPIVIESATVIAKVINPTPTPTPCTKDTCGVLTAPLNKDLVGKNPEEAFGLPVDADAGDAIIVFVNGLRNAFGPTQAYTSYTGLPSDINIDPLTNNQILFVLTTTTTPPTSYQILVTITAK